MAEEWAQPLYKSRAWRDLRKAVIAERGQRCAHCGRMIADPSKIIADHIEELTPSNIMDAGIALNQDNIQLLCNECHIMKHKKFGSFRQKVYLVYGSPCSGKKTFVKRAMFRGDFVVEIDTIWKSMSWLKMHDKPDALKSAVFRMRDTAIDVVATRTGKWATAYVIGGYPRRAERENLARRLGAELIYQKSTREECLLRAKSMGPFANSMIKYVNQWWDVYEE